MCTVHVYRLLFVLSLMLKFLSCNRFLDVKREDLRHANITLEEANLKAWTGLNGEQYARHEL